MRAVQTAPPTPRRADRCGRRAAPRAARGSDPARRGLARPRCGCHDGSGSSRRRAAPSPGNAVAPCACAIVTTPSSSGSRRLSSTGRANSGSSSRKSTPRCARLTSPGRGTRPPPTIAAVECGVVRRSHRPAADERSPAREKPRAGVDAGHFERLLAAHRRQQPRQCSGHHGLARSGRTEQQQVVTARRGDHERTLRGLLSADLREVDLRDGVAEERLGFDRRHRTRAPRARSGRRRRRSVARSRAPRARRPSPPRPRSPPEARPRGGRDASRGSRGSSRLRTGRSRPSRASSPAKIAWSSGSPRPSIAPSAASSPIAIGRSKTGPSLRRSPGARLIVARRHG